MHLTCTSTLHCWSGQEGVSLYVVDGKLGFKIVAPDLRDNFGWKVHNNFFPNKLDHQSSFYWVMLEINLKKKILDG